MPRVGSQYRENLEDTGYLVRGKVDGAVVLQKPGSPLEHWRPNDQYAGYVVVIDGIGHEFVDSIAL